MRQEIKLIDVKISEREDELRLKSEKHWGPTTEWSGKVVGGGKVVGVDPTKFHSNRIKIAQSLFVGWFLGGWGRLNIPPDMLHSNLLLLNLN